MNNVYKAVLQHIARHGVPPTVREVCEATRSNSTSVTRVALDGLVESGKLVKRNRKYLPPSVARAASVAAKQLL